MRKKLFVAFEGLDGSGKSTQVKRVAEVLSNLGLEVFTTSHPSDSPFGKLIREKLKNGDETMEGWTSVLAFLTDIHHNFNDFIKPELNSKKVVLCDRFIDSTLAYATTIPFYQMEQLTSYFANSIEPDIVFFMDLKPEECVERLSKRNEPLDNIEKQSLVFFKKVYDRYLKLMSTKSNCVIIDGNTSINDITKIIVTTILKRTAYMEDILDKYIETEIHDGTNNDDKKLDNIQKECENDDCSTQSSVNENIDDDNGVDINQFYADTHLLMRTEMDLLLVDIENAIKLGLETLNVDLQKIDTLRTKIRGKQIASLNDSEYHNFLNTIQPIMNRVMSLHKESGDEKA